MLLENVTFDKNSFLQVITEEIQLENTNVRLFIKREDLIHPLVSGNKFRKLKYNLIEARKRNKNTILTFGGAFSNHIAATAYAGKENNFKTIGIIRGEELGSKIDENPTLKFAQECGMQLEFISREQYRVKDTSFFLEELTQKYGDFYLIPEGGTNELAVKGCVEVIGEKELEYDYVAVAVGTGGTISGLINGAALDQKILGFPALKGDFLQKDICKFVKNKNWELILDYHFGGYAKVSIELIEFINKFYAQYKIPLDPIYTGKMVFGVIDLINKNYFPDNAKILLIHTGGIQGVAGMNLKLKNKKIPIIKIND